MACNNSIIGINKDCDLSNSKGLLNLYLVPTNFISGTTLSGGSSASGGIITTVTMSGASKFSEFVFPKGAGAALYTEDAVIDEIAETTEFTQTLTFQVPRREKAKRQAFAALTAGRRNLTAIVKDYNGLYWMFGYINSVNVSGLGGGSETANYTLTLTGREPVQAPEVLDSIIAAIITPAV